MGEEEFALYLQYHYAVCERPDLVGATAHALDILLALFSMPLFDASFRCLFSMPIVHGMAISMAAPFNLFSRFG
jgi:hypothetical protein